MEGSTKASVSRLLAKSVLASGRQARTQYVQEVVDGHALGADGRRLHDQQVEGDGATEGCDEGGVEREV